MGNLLGQNPTELVLLVILLTAGYLAVLPGILKRVRGQGIAWLAAAVLLFVFLCLGGILALMVQSSGSFGQVLFVCLVFISAGILGGCVWNFARSFQYINKGAAALFFIYLAAVLYITLFSRLGENNSSIRMEVLASVKQAVQTGSVQELRHLILNFAMFIPLGGLFRWMQPKRRAGLLPAFLTGMMISTLIEAIQMIYRIGQCDIDDIIGNSLGMAAGFLICRLILRRPYESPDD